MQGFALDYFGEVPKTPISENLNSVEMKADSYEAFIIGDFLDFANQYGCTVLSKRSKQYLVMLTYGSHHIFVQYNSPKNIKHINNIYF